MTLQDAIDTITLEFDLSPGEEDWKIVESILLRVITTAYADGYADALDDDEADDELDHSEEGW